MAPSQFGGLKMSWSMTFLVFSLGLAAIFILLLFLFVYIFIYFFILTIRHSHSVFLRVVVYDGWLAYVFMG